MVKTEDGIKEEPEDDEPKEQCKICKRRFYGTLTLGRHLVKKECTKPDIKPLFEPTVSNVSITVLDSSDENAGK